MMLTEMAVATLVIDLGIRPLAGDEMREVEGAKSEQVSKFLYVSRTNPSVGKPGYVYVFTQTIDGHTCHFYEEEDRRG